MVSRVNQPRLRIHEQMAYWNVYIKYQDKCYAQLNQIWLIQLPPMMSMSFQTTRHGPSAIPITRYLKPPQMQPFLDPFVADWHKIGERRQSLTNRGNQSKNAKCIDYDYKVGDRLDQIRLSLHYHWGLLRLGREGCEPLSPKNSLDFKQTSIMPVCIVFHKATEAKVVRMGGTSGVPTGNKVLYNMLLVTNKGILRKAESAYGKEPWTITTVHTNGTIRIQRGTKTERLSIW